jgi:hypothetical protein
MNELKPISLQTIKEYKYRLKNDLKPEIMFERLPYFNTDDISELNKESFYKFTLIGLGVCEFDPPDHLLENLIDQINFSMSGYKSMIENLQNI